MPTDASIDGTTEQKILPFDKTTDSPFNFDKTTEQKIEPNDDFDPFDMTSGPEILPSDDPFDGNNEQEVVETDPPEVGPTETNFSTRPPSDRTEAIEKDDKKRFCGHEFAEEQIPGNSKSRCAGWLLENYHRFKNGWRSCQEVDTRDVIELRKLPIFHLKTLKALLLFSIERI